MALLVKYECTQECAIRANAALDRLAKEGKLPNFLSRRDFHVTVLFARKWSGCPSPTDTLTDGSVRTYGLLKSADGFAKIMDPCGGAVGTAVALLLDVPLDDPLRRRRDRLVSELDAQLDFPDYLPHVTVGYVRRALTDEEERSLLRALNEVFHAFSLDFDEERIKLFETKTLSS